MGYGFSFAFERRFVFLYSNCNVYHPFHNGAARQWLLELSRLEPYGFCALIR